MDRSAMIAFLEQEAPNAKAKDIVVRLKREAVHDELRRDAITRMDQTTIIGELRKLAARARSFVS
jgi:hypothetical protein